MRPELNSDKRKELRTCSLKILKATQLSFDFMVSVAYYILIFVSSTYRPYFTTISGKRKRLKMAFFYKSTENLFFFSIADYSQLSEFVFPFSIRQTRWRYSHYSLFKEDFLLYNKYSNSFQTYKGDNRAKSSNS